MVLGPGPDTFFGHRLYWWTLRPLFRLGMSGGLVARLLLTMSIGSFCANSFLDAGLLANSSDLFFFSIILYTNFRVLPYWDQVAAEFCETQRLHITALFRLRGLAMARQTLCSASIGVTVVLVWAGIRGTGHPFVVAITLWSGVVNLTLGLYATTVVGWPPKSLQRVALERMKAALARRPHLRPAFG